MNKKKNFLFVDKLKKAAQKKIGLRPDALTPVAWETICLKLIETYGYQEVQRLDEEAIEKIIESQVALFTVSESWFFREEYQLQEASLYLLSLSKQKKELIRVLSVGCASGEEVYSLAMLLLERKRSLEGFDLLGVDINPSNIQVASFGSYELAFVRGISDVRRKRFFKERKQTLLARALFFPFVHFELANVLDPLWKLKGFYDVIFCRNVLLYLGSSSRRQLISKLKHCLKDEGRLYVSSVEALFLDSGCKTLVTKEKLQEEKRASFALSLKKKEKLLLPHLPKKDFAKSLCCPLESEINSLFLAKKLADEGEYRKASKVLNDLLRKNRSLSDAYYLLGVIELEQDRKDKALIYFSKVLVYNEHHQEALRYLSLLSNDQLQVFKDRR